MRSEAYAPSAPDNPASTTLPFGLRNWAPPKPVRPEGFTPRCAKPPRGYLSSVRLTRRAGHCGRSTRWGWPKRALCRMVAVTAAGITRIFPDLTEDLLLNLFHKGAQAQWTSRNIDWTGPIRLSERKRLALARLLTPVYFGEQTAMAGASSILPSVMAAGEATAQLYIASFIMDEARHFETLTRLYRTLGHDPLGIRDMPELLRYYHRLRQGDRVDWVWGILISDIIGKHFYRELGPKQAAPDPFFGGLTTRILKDESRHLAFAEHYLKRNL